MKRTSLFFCAIASLLTSCAYVPHTIICNDTTCQPYHCVSKHGKKNRYCGNYWQTQCSTPCNNTEAGFCDCPCQVQPLYKDQFQNFCTSSAFAKELLRVSLRVSQSKLKSPPLISQLVSHLRITLNIFGKIQKSLNKKGVRSWQPSV